MAIKISACVITKNEEKNMPSWLKCMKTVADEMIVVDTGSTDNTVKFAQAAGAKLYNFKWINDFAAAKNYAIERATGDWILFLDADERFADSAQTVLRQEVERFDRDKSVACLLCRLIDIDVDNDNRVFSTTLLPRIFRRSPHIRYAGAIHEQLENHQGNKRMVFAEKLEILHTGYSSSIIRSKSERNLPILLKELEEAATEKERLRLYPYLMDAYNILGQYEQTVFYAEKCISAGYQMIGGEGSFYETMIMAMYNSNRPAKEVLEVIDRAEKDFPLEPFFAFTRGMALDKQGDYIGAEKAVLHGLELRKAQDDKMRQGIGISDTSRGLLPYAYERLGKIYYLKGDLQKAADNYLMALQEHKYQKDSLQGLCRVLGTNEDSDLIELLNTLYERHKDGAFIVKTLKGYVSPGVMAYYGKEVQGYEASFAYMAAGRFDGAVVKLGERYKELIQLGVLSANNMAEYPQDNYLKVLVSDEYLKRFERPTKEADAVRRLKEYRVRVGADL